MDEDNVFDQDGSDELHVQLLREAEATRQAELAQSGFVEPLPDEEPDEENQFRTNPLEERRRSQQTFGYFAEDDEDDDEDGDYDQGDEDKEDEAEEDNISETESDAEDSRITDVASRRAEVAGVLVESPRQRWVMERAQIPVPPGKTLDSMIESLREQVRQYEEEQRELRKKIADAERERKEVDRKAVERIRQPQERSASASPEQVWNESVLGRRKRGP